MPDPATHKALRRLFLRCTLSCGVVLCERLVRFMRAWCAPARGFGFVLPELELSFDGESAMPEATGNPAGDPRELLVWFVNHCAAMGITIELEWTLATGSYVSALSVDKPGIVRGHIDGLGEVEIELT